MTPEEMRQAARDMVFSAKKSGSEIGALATVLWMVSAEICERLDRMLAERERGDE